ncbi:MAG TPA: glycoside hydrolase family 6 protein [Polyangiaceae bacterium]|jgi:endoglucanase|nr:glycoside hydrolase family 6 protein [Polyangiaceae bacterium]
MPSSLGISKIFSTGSLLRSLGAVGLLGAFVACGGSNAGGPPTTGPASTALAPSNDPGPADDAPITDPPTPPKATGNPIKGMKLWIDPETNAALRANALDKTQPDVAKLFRERIAKYSQALWLGEWNSNVYRKVKWTVDQAASTGEVPTFIAYNVPGRDCGQHSAGGLKSKEAYQRWIRKIAAGIGDRAAIVVLEPDALGLLEKENCLTKDQQAERVFLLHDAVKVLRQNPKTVVYLDGGHSRWHPVDEAARLLKMAGVEDANGFALNTSNYRGMDELLPFAKQLSEKLGGVHYVIDTSRNGAGPYGVEWCNPPGRKLGLPPTTETADPNCDAYLWLKRPGESDGACNGAPAAGAFWDKQAIELATPMDSTAAPASSSSAAPEAAPAAESKDAKDSKTAAKPAKGAAKPAKK